MREKEIWQTSKGGYCQLVARATVILQQLLLSCNSKATGRRIVSRSTLFFQQRQQLSCSKENCHLVVAAAILQQGQQSSCSKGGNCHFVARTTVTLDLSFPYVLRQKEYYPYLSSISPSCSKGVNPYERLPLSQPPPATPISHCFTSLFPLPHPPQSQ